MTRKFTRFTALLLCLTLSIYSVLPLRALAQEASPEPSPEPTPEIQTFPDPTPEPSPEPTSDLTPVPEPTPTPFDPYNHPDYASSEYDIWKVQYQAWKEEQDRLEAEKEAQEDIIKEEEKERELFWEANDNNDAWVDSHGGNETYFISGAWEADQVAVANTSDFSDTFPVDSKPKDCSTGIKSEDPLSEIESSTGTVDGSATSTDIDTVDVSNQNCASIENDSFAGSTSGENSQVGNDGDINTSTGPGTSEGRVVNQGNTNVTDSDDLSN